MESLVNIPKDEGHHDVIDDKSARDRSLSPEKDTKSDKRLVNVDKN
jgi:hypothetical protein